MKFRSEDKYNVIVDNPKEFYHEHHRRGISLLVSSVLCVSSLVPSVLYLTSLVSSVLLGHFVNFSGQEGLQIEELADQEDFLS